MAQNKNPLEELSELFAIASDQPDSASTDHLHYQLRFGETELVLEDGRVCYVSVQRAFLQLDLSGLTIQPGSEHGNIPKSNEVTIQHASKKTSQASFKGKVEAALNRTPSGQASATGELSRSTTETAAYETTKTRVTARGGQRWEIVEPDKQPLDGTYLAHDVALCRLQAKRGANQREVTARVYVKQRDLLFRYEGSGLVSFVRLTRNKERLLNILIAKALNTKAPADSHLYAGSLILSEAVSEHEG